MAISHKGVNKNGKTYRANLIDEKPPPHKTIV